MDSNPPCRQLPVTLTPKLTPALLVVPRYRAPSDRPGVRCSVPASWSSFTGRRSPGLEVPFLTRSWALSPSGMASVLSPGCGRLHQAVQQTLDALVERLLLLNWVVEQLAEAGEGLR